MSGLETGAWEHIGAENVHDQHSGWWCFYSSQALKSKYANLYIAGAADPEGDYQLDVDVSGLIFSHHPLFSREHVLASRLAQLYDQYLTRQHNNLTGNLTDKVSSDRFNVRVQKAVFTTTWSFEIALLQYFEDLVNFSSSSVVERPKERPA